MGWFVLGLCFLFYFFGSLALLVASLWTTMESESKLGGDFGLHFETLVLHYGIYLIYTLYLIGLVSSFGCFYSVYWVLIIFGLFYFVLVLILLFGLVGVAIDWFLTYLPFISVGY